MKTYKENHTIIKPFQYGYYNYVGNGALVIDTENDTIGVDILSGPAPYARDIILFLLSDRDIRLMIRGYQEQKRSRNFALRTSSGSSGRQDIYINYYNDLGLQTGGKKLLHKSCFDKLNEGWIKMWIGDFTELVAYLMEQSGATYDLKNARKLRNLSGCHYEKGYFCNDATKKVSKII